MEKTHYPIKLDAATMDDVATSNSYLATDTKMKDVKSSVPRGGPTHYCPKQSAISSDLQETNDCMSP